MIEFFPVVENVWCLRRPSYLTCSYVVRTLQGLVFIDASMDSQGKDIQYALEKLGEAPAAVCMSILTHWHNDHSSGADYIQHTCSRPVHTHPLEGQKLVAPVNRSLSGRLSGWIPESGPLVLLKGLLNDGPSIRLDTFSSVKDGDVLLDQFQIIETPGHTAGHISVWDKKNGVLFAGDALAVIDQHLRRMARPVTENLEQGYESMLKLLAFEADTVCPGHRQPLLKAASALKKFREELLTNRHWPLLG